MSKPLKFLHYEATFTDGKGIRTLTLLHDQPELLQWLTSAASLQGEERIEVVALGMFCVPCQRRGENAPVFMCQMPNWAGPTGE